MTYTEVFTQLVRAEIRLWNSLDDHLQESAALTLANFQALAAIANLPEPVRVQDIATEVHITVGASSKLVDRLERDGLVRREANRADRRSSIILLTETGQRSYSAAATAVEEHLRALLAPSYPVARAVELASQLVDLRATVEEGAAA
jgi:DNA-binding MarR family transcriptional regulator